MAPDPIKKIFRFIAPTFILTLLTSLAPLFAPIETYAAKNATPAAEATPDLAKKPKYAVVGYITAYLYNDFSAVGYFDADITTAIEQQLSAAPEDGKDAEKRQIEIISRNEHEKRTSGAYAPFTPQGRSATALSPLYKVLYPGMKYRIIAVQDVKPKTRGAAKRHCAKEVTLELIYPDTGCAPYHRGKRIKKGLVKVRLRKWNWLLEYKVCGYVPVKEGMEYHTIKGVPLNTGTLKGV